MWKKRVSFHAELVRKELGLRLSGALHAAGGYIRNVVGEATRCIWLSM